MKRHLLIPGLILMSALGLNAATLDELWQNPAVEQRIADDIRTNRMDNVVLKITGANGVPPTKLTIRVEQTRHEFLFGANIFMLGGFPTPEENRKFEQTYTSIFNYATVPFYWSDLEPEAGKPRFSKESPAIYRRPPPDSVIEFCQQQGMEMKGHPLVWHQWYPKWRPENPLEAMLRNEQRITEIAARYGHLIKRWEVVNEPCERHLYAEKWFNLPENYVFRSFDKAAKCFPASDRLALNEATTFSWVKFDGVESPYYRLIRELLDRGARVEEIGMQMHFFSEKAWQPVLAGQQFAPADQFKVLDRYSDFGLPLAITEITLPTLPNTPAGEQAQATVARNFYRLWFSHPHVVAISWWNLVDATAAKGEDKMLAGLVHRDFSPKLAYKALDQLINHDWKTKFETNSAAGGKVSFRGFHGEYTVTAQVGGKTVKQTFHLKKGAANEWNFKL